MLKQKMKDKERIKLYCGRDEIVCKGAAIIQE